MKYCPTIFATMRTTMRFAHKIFHLADIDNMQSNKQEKHNVYCINL